MTRMIDADDVIDAREIATMLGLSHSNTVSLYQRRYPDMPRPVYPARPTPDRGSPERMLATTPATRCGGALA